MHTATAVPSPTKIETRERALIARRAYAESLPLQTRRELEGRLMARVIPHLVGIRTVAAYHAMADEIDPLSILEAVAAGGGVAALPWFADRDAPMIFREAPATVAGPWSLPQPDADAAAVRPDLVLVPLVAGDARCNRIGHGKGHYDRALARMRTDGAVRTIGLAWDMQIVDGEIPVDPWDVALDAIATPSRWIEKD